MSFTPPGPWKPIFWSACHTASFYRRGNHLSQHSHSKCRAGWEDKRHPRGEEGAGGDPGRLVLPARGGSGRQEGALLPADVHPGNDGSFMLLGPSMSGHMQAFHGEKELFKSEHLDWCFASTIEGKCKAHSLHYYQVLVSHLSWHQKSTGVGPCTEATCICWCSPSQRSQMLTSSRASHTRCIRHAFRYVCL